MDNKTGFYSSRYEVDSFAQKSSEFFRVLGEHNPECVLCGRKPNYSKPFYVGEYRSHGVCGECVAAIHAQPKRIDEPARRRLRGRMWTNVSRLLRQSSEMIDEGRRLLAEIRGEVMENQAYVEHIRYLQKKAKWKLDEIVEEARVRSSDLEFLKANPEYPCVPDPAVEASEDGDGLPSESGIYFVWSGDAVVYVGQSVKLCSRARTRHQNICEGDWISWVLIPKGLLNWAECHYIGLCRPSRNFGKSRVAPAPED